ncbi:hypothetical protein [Pseudoalteromonas luteoviolacea]|uniref:Phospholipase A2 domain-containing protein n=1 Tax=Pseudoalteromonas luteoviolacea NCIMB 1942 TaxID=1365253 RepID=A0A166ZVZ2_9GAMM|nr:hypothetical protein [Pseudoalteromonas luteoviolacea]KZN44722.1 hypothetical protein N482_16150 [Pseudoalteromonas luteoviolacea NCIMB 1942]
MRAPCLGILSIFLMACTSSQTVRTPSGEEVSVTCQPVYGKWCGKSYPAYETTGYKPRPVDQWDAACRAHDLCYERYGEEGEESCDRQFTYKLERLYHSGIPIPHQMVNAYNVFKEDLSFRTINIPFSDIWNANTLACDGSEGKAALFCDVGVRGLNCQITDGSQAQGARCACTYPASYGPFGYFQGGTLYGIQRTANSF